MARDDRDGLYSGTAGVLKRHGDSIITHGELGAGAMNWIERWMERRRVKALKRQIARMKNEAKAAEIEPLMPAVETISNRIRRERLVILEKAIEKIESDKPDGVNPPA